MNDFETWGEAISSSFWELWDRFIDFVPSLIAALLVFVIGWFIAAGIGHLVRTVLEKVAINRLAQAAKIHDRLKKVGISLEFGQIIGMLVKWFLILVFLMAAADILGLSQVNEFLNRVLLYVPNVVVAVVVLLLGFWFSQFAETVVVSSAKAGNFSSANFLGATAKWAILLFSVLAALVQLNVAESLLNTLFTGLVAMIAIAGGIAFGLGGRDSANRVLEHLRKDFTKGE